MSLLTPFARKRAAQDVQVKPPCRHIDLAPRWDSAAAMGKADLVTHYQCCSCGENVSKEAAQAAS